MFMTDGFSIISTTHTVLVRGDGECVNVNFIKWIYVLNISQNAKTN